MPRLLGGPPLEACAVATIVGERHHARVTVPERHGERVQVDTVVQSPRAPNTCRRLWSDKRGTFSAVQAFARSRVELHQGLKARPSLPSKPAFATLR